MIASARNKSDELTYYLDMNHVLLFVFALIAFAAGCSTKSLAEDTATVSQPEAEMVEQSSPVIVELFTSEGCSSCPPADRTLSFLQENQPVRNAEVIALGFHVDYWDYLGWRDKFSSRQFSNRQRDYVQAFRLDSSYTPQMVVDGETEFVGSNLQRANGAIEAAAKRPKATVSLTIKQGFLEAAIDNVPIMTPATVFLAVAENGLSTKVRGGENRGNNLVHPAVVRHLNQIGSIRDGKLDKKIRVELPTASDWNTDSISYVVFIQEDQSKKIVGVGQGKAK